MTKEEELNVLRDTLKNFGLGETRIDEIVNLYTKELKMKETFDPDFDDDLELE